jgi:hypothetical protein
VLRTRLDSLVEAAERGCLDAVAQLLKEIQVAFFPFSSCNAFEHLEELLVPLQGTALARFDCKLDETFCHIHHAVAVVED